MPLFKHVANVLDIYMKRILSQFLYHTFMPGVRYGGISLPDDLLEEIDRVIERLETKNIKLGFNSRADFIKNAIRAYIKDLTVTYLVESARRSE